MITFPPVFKDRRTHDLKQRYETLEQKRADAWLDIAMARLSALQTFKQTVGLLKRQAG